ncbi:RNA-binding protein 33-like isoform X2 [Periplaneta americana]|uniref:RNA-binding protein 33-like isoform X2 n=1 Tax=Periplaneta americana TaxID=6978 RepID=UPI0037E8F728
MSDNNDDTLLEGDLGDDIDYDLGNEDEDALLADDYDIQGSSHRTVYLEQQQEVLESQDGYHREPEEPFDDVLDLGVTEGDALDDLDSELQESQETVGTESMMHVQEHHDPNIMHHESGHLDNSVHQIAEHQQQADVTDTSHISQETSYVEGEDPAANQVVAGVESEEEEDDAEESRGDRFKTERTTIVSLKGSNKSYGNIPDSLDNVCVEDAKQMGRRDGAWRGGRRGRGFGAVGRNGPRPQFLPGNAFNNNANFNIHPHPQPQQQQPQQQGFAGPRFGPAGFVRPPGRGNARGGMYNRPPMNQQQSPHKILINPHFRGAVQPHPEARLIWDTEVPGNQTPLPPPHTPQGDGLLPFPSNIQTLDPPYHSTPQGGGYPVQQFQPPPQHEPHSVAPPPRYDSPSQQGGYYPQEQSYPTEQHNVPHWQENCEPPQQVGNEMYTQPSTIPMGMEGNNLPVAHHEAMFHHPNHAMGDPGMNHGQPSGMYGGGMVQYESVPQQQTIFHDEGSYPPSSLPTHPHFQPPQPPPLSPSSHRLPPPMMANMWHCAVDGSTDDGLQHVVATQPAPTQYHSQGIYRLQTSAGMHSGMKYRQPSPSPFHHQPGAGFVNQGGRLPRGGARFPAGIQMNSQQQIMRNRRPAGGPAHAQQQQTSQQQQNRSPKKRTSFEANIGANVQFKQARFEAGTKRKKRMPDMSNLHEVQTVDMLPTDVCAQLQQPEEEEDEETREYRKKIEQQKREREKFLQRKEERRKLAALEKQRELQRKDIDIQAGGDASQVQMDPPQGNAIATIVNRNTIEPQPIIHHPVVRHVAQQQKQQHQQHQHQQQQIHQQQPLQKIQQHIPQNVQVHNVKNRVNVQLPQPLQQQFHQDVRLPQAAPMPIPSNVIRQVRGGRGRGVGRGRGAGRGQPGFVTRPPQQQQQPVQQVTQLPLAQPEVKLVPKMKVPAPGQRIVRAPQPGSVANQSSTATPRRLVLSQGSGQVTPVARQVIQQVPKGRTVVLRGANSGTKPVPQTPNQQAIGAQRIVVASKAVPSQGAAPRQATGGRSVVSTKVITPQQEVVVAQQPALPRTKTVSIDNLAASTTEHQLKSMCQGIGVVENIQMLPKQRRAILRFANPTSAATFYKRYQRKIIDLSLISVSLISQ